jgi:adenylate kinase family enzyme
MQENWNLSGLIIEGICGSGKTTLLRRILQSPRFLQKEYLSSIVLSEHHTQRVMEEKEHAGTLTPADHLDLLDQHVSYLEQVKARLDQMPWCDNSGINMRLPFLIERFHFTHVFHYPYLNWEHVAGIDRRMAALGGKLVVLTLDGSTLEERIILGRSPGWRDYIRRFGDTNQKVVDHYARQQDYLRELAEKTSMEKLILNTTCQDEDQSLERVLGFWGAV